MQWLLERLRPLSEWRQRRNPGSRPFNLLRNAFLLLLGVFCSPLITAAVAAVFFSAFPENLSLTYIKILFGLYQLLYVVPLGLASWRRGYFAFAAGISGGALLVLFVNVSFLLIFVGAYR